MAALGCEPRAASALGVLPEVAEPSLLLLWVSAGPGALYHPGEVGGRPRSQFKLPVGPGGTPSGARWALQATLLPTNSGCKRGGGPRLGSRAEPGRSNKWTWMLGKGGLGPRRDKGRLSSPSHLERSPRARPLGSR